MGYVSLRDYGIIGNHETAVMISRHGSVDWCCMAYLDSPSHFAALLDENQGGKFQIAPAGDFHSEQSYLSLSNVLETRFETPSGRAVITDWMPIADRAPCVPAIIRRVSVLDGSIDWVLHCTPRFGYASENVTAEKTREGFLF